MYSSPKIWSPFEGLSFMMKAILQGKAFNTEPPETFLGKALLMLATMADIFFWYIIAIFIAYFIFGGIR